MKITITICSFLLFCSSYAVEITTSWNNDYKKIVEFSCVSEEEEHFCFDLCDAADKCQINETICRNCLSNSVYLTKIFNEMSTSYRNTGNKVSYRDLIDILLTGKFVTITSKSVYNLIDRYDSIALQERFRSLCIDETLYPVVFFRSEEVLGPLGDVLYVACDNGVFEMTDRPQVVFPIDIANYDQNYYL